MKRTVLPERAFYEADGLIYEEYEAWGKLKQFIPNSLKERILSCGDTDVKEASFKSLYSLYERVMTQQASMKDLNKRMESCFERAKKKANQMKYDRVNCIVAVDALFCIGKDGKLPFKQATDLKHVKELTTNNIIILGNETFKEIGVLPNREMRVITKDPNLVSKHKNVKYYTEYKRALYKPDDDFREIFIFGGEAIYHLYFPYITDLYITFVDTVIEDGDRFFPELPITSFTPRECISFLPDEKNEFAMNISHLRKIDKRKLEAKINKNSNKAK